jgi:hypothetical protein
MYSLVIAAFLALVGASTSSSAQADACTVQVPETLVSRIHADYPQFRPIRASDYSPDSLVYPKAQGVSCPGIAASTIRGIHYTVLFVLDEKTGHTLLLVAHPLVAARWSVARLADFGKEGASSSYVEPVAAGRYVDLFATRSAPGDFEPEPGRVMHYRSRNPGFMAGTMESTGAAYFYTGKRWVHLWLLD